MSFFATGSSLYSSKRSPSPGANLKPSTTPPHSFHPSFANDIKPSPSALSDTLNEDVKPESKSKVKESVSSSTATSKAKYRVTSEAERESIIRMALVGKKPAEIAKYLGLKANTVYKFIRSRSAGWIAAEGSAAANPMRSPSASPKKKSAGRSKK